MIAINEATIGALKTYRRRQLEEPMALGRGVD
ncbi:hypothetical protein BH24ACT15_BH24ACT15_20370 [soil metagenome]